MAAIYGRMLRIYFAAYCGLHGFGPPVLLLETFLWRWPLKIGPLEKTSWEEAGEQEDVAARGGEVREVVGRSSLMCSCRPCWF